MAHLRTYVYNLLIIPTVVLAVTYDFTDIPGFKSIPPCAQNAVTYGVKAPSYGNCQKNDPPTAYFSCLCTSDSSAVKSHITSALFGLTDIYTLCGTPEAASATSVWGNLCAQNARAAETSGASSANSASSVHTRASHSLPSPTSGGSKGPDHDHGLSKRAKIAIGVVTAVIGIFVLIGLGLLWRRIIRTGGSAAWARQGREKKKNMDQYILDQQQRQRRETYTGS